MLTSSRALVVLCLFSLPAAADKVRLDYPCTKEMAKRASASDAELSKVFGKKVVGECLCYLEACATGSVFYRLPMTGLSQLELHVEHRRSLGGKAAAFPQLLAPRELTAFAARLALHPLIGALLKTGGATCTLDVGRWDFNARCTAGGWAVSLTEDEVPEPPKVQDGTGARRFFKLDHRLPLAALKDDPDFAFARAHADVVKFLAGGGDVRVTFSQQNGRRFVLERGVEPGKYGIETAKESLTVMLEAGRGGWREETKGVRAVCPGVPSSCN